MESWGSGTGEVLLELGCIETVLQMAVRPACARVDVHQESPWRSGG